MERNWLPMTPSQRWSFLLAICSLALVMGVCLMELLALFVHIPQLIVTGCSLGSTSMGVVVLLFAIFQLVHAQRKRALAFELLVWRLILSSCIFSCSLGSMVLPRLVVLPHSLDLLWIIVDVGGLIGYFFLMIANALLMEQLPLRPGPTDRRGV